MPMRTEQTISPGEDHVLKAPEKTVALEFNNLSLLLKLRPCWSFPIIIIFK